MSAHTIPTYTNQILAERSRPVAANTRTIEPIAAVTDDDAAMARAVKLGTLVGIPLMLAFGVTIGLLAGTGLRIALAVALWAIINGAWFYGGIAFIPRHTEPWIHYAGDDTWTHEQ